MPWPLNRFRAAPGILVVAALSAPLAAQHPADARPFAARLQHLVGQRTGPAVLRAVHAEGRVLVFTIDGTIGWRAFVPVARLSQSFLTRYCRQPSVRGYFNGRRLLRIDTVELGRRRWPGQPIARCP